MIIGALGAAIVVAAAIAWTGVVVRREIRGLHEEVGRLHLAQLISLFAPAVAAVARNPCALLVWQPLADAARTMFPNDFAALDRASGAAFPFSGERIQEAHARWTTEWLAWERAHDVEFKLKTAAAERELQAGGGAVERARLDSIEREKLDLYQRRYEEYVRVSKALQALIAPGKGHK
jgi:hypothetical protein